MLEPDQVELLVSIALFNMNNMGNASNIPFFQPKFEPTSTAVSINCLLFASLGSSLVAALASVVALQWVSDYDAAITRGGSSPEDRAKRRQFRFAGVIEWRMGEMIATLPFLLYSSVLLFWAGIIQWMCSIHIVVGSVVAGGTALAVLFYISTTLLSAVCVSAPFRTPSSKALYWLFCKTTSSVGHLLLWTQPDRVLLWFASFFQRINSVITFSLREDTASASASDSTSWFDIPVLPSPPPERVVPWVITHLLSHPTSRQREDYEAGSNLWLGQQALGWLARELVISVDSNGRLLFLISELLSSKELLSKSILDVPWWEILDSLGRHYLTKIIDGTLTETEYEVVGRLVRWSQVPEIAIKISPSVGYDNNPVNDLYWSQFCFDPASHSYFEGEAPENMTFLLSRDAPIPSADSRYEIEATIKFIKWRNSTGPKKVDFWIDIFDQVDLYSSKYLESCVQCFQLVMSCYARSSYRALWPSARSRFCIEVCA